MIVCKPSDFKEWRNQARQLLQRRVPPEEITWIPLGEQASLFSEDLESALGRVSVQQKDILIPNEFMNLAKRVACFRSARPWPLLYQLAYRLVFENRNLLEVKVDPAVKEAFDMRKAVDRDMHKMKAFVRFKRVSPRVKAESKAAVDSSESPGKAAIAQEKLEDSEVFIAWFEPKHLIVPGLASFFAKRFTNMHWSIFTPDISMHWDMAQLSYSRGVPRPPAREDELEDLWLTYYKSIFNPARLKLKAMQAEMPKRYWKNLPEAPLIDMLTKKAHQEVQDMLSVHSRKMKED